MVSNGVCWTPHFLYRLLGQAVQTSDKNPSDPSPTPVSFNIQYDLPNLINTAGSTRFVDRSTVHGYSSWSKEPQICVHDNRGIKMKVVSVLGSPRENGNSSTIANRFCTTAEKFGAEVKTFVLNKLDYRGCQGCFLCKTKLDRCVLEDDLTEVLDAVRGTDVLVLASPVYYWDISGQLKCFMDRTFSYLVPDFITNPVKSRLAPGKKLIFILAQNNPDPNSFPDIFRKFDYFFKAYGFSERHLIRAFGVNEPGEVEKQEDTMKLAEETAEKVCGCISF